MTGEWLKANKCGWVTFDAEAWSVVVRFAELRSQLRELAAEVTR